MINRKAALASILLASTTLLPPALQAQSAPAAEPTLEAQFRDPPQSARPRVWWHWMNGNVSKDGIAKDLAWMKRVGIGGLQNFDAGLATPQVVDKRLVYMTPEWKDAFRFAAIEADRLGLELAIAASPGWSETGGPWVKAEDGLKKLVWSEATVAGGRRFNDKLVSPPRASGSFQDFHAPDEAAAVAGEHQFVPPEHYADIAVLALPVASRGADPLPRLTGPDGKEVDRATLFDPSLMTGVNLPRGSAAAPSAVVATYARPQTIRSASMFLPGAKGMFSGPSVEPVLEASDDGANWRRIAVFPVTSAPSTVSFAPVTALQFRLVLRPVTPAQGNAGDAAPGIAPPGGFVEAMAAAARAPFDLRRFTLSSSAVIDQFESKAGFAIAADYDALGVPDAQAAGVDPARVIDLTGRMKPDGTLDWQAPAGNWRVLRIGSSLLGTTNHPAPPEATGLEVDKFDGAAVRAYLEHYIAMYRDAAGPDLVGKRGVQAILTDSIEVGAANWTPRMVERFKALRGYDPTPWLPALTGVLMASPDRSDRFLRDWRQTLADLMASEHYGTVAAVAHENGLKVYGEALENGRPSLGDDIAMRSHADVPMAALWAYSRRNGPNPSYLADMKGASSVAHLYGQNVVAAESMTSMLAPWAYGPNDLRRIVDLEFVSGINRPVIHTSVHQPVDDKVPGLSLAIFGQYFNRHESWAQMARPWVDYIARSSLLLQSGCGAADLAFFYGEEGPLTALYGQKPNAEAPRLHAFDYVNRAALFDALTLDGGELVSKGGVRYKALYLGGSSRRMTLAALRRIAQLAEGGATVIGMAPEGSPTLNDDAAAFAALTARLWGGGQVTRVGAGRVIALRDADAALALAGASPEFRMENAADGADVPFVHRVLPDGQLWFLVNRKDREERFAARFRVTGKAPELWHADTGLTEPVSYRMEGGETVVPLSLAAEQSVFVVFRKDAAASSAAVPAVREQAAATLGGPWTVRFQPGRGAPAQITLPALASLSESADPGVKYFSGEATYARTLTLPKGVKPGAPLWLDLGQVAKIAEVSVNGKVVGSVWHKPWRVDIGGAVRKGANQLEVKVANLWVNRLIGDAQPGSNKVTWTALPTYKADAPLRQSGLIGPVTLTTEQR